MGETRSGWPGNGNRRNTKQERSREGALFCLIFLRQPFVPAMVVVFRGKGDDSAGKVMSIRK